MRLLPIVFFMAGLAVAAPVAADTSPMNSVMFHDTFDNLNSGRWYVSNGWSNGDFQSCEWWSGAIVTHNGVLQLSLTDTAGKTRPYSCGEIHTNMRFAYGVYEARMRSAAGSGLNTAFFTYVGPPTGSPEHDEIDFEFLGKNTHAVQVNYFTDGKPQDGKLISLDFDASQEFHNYAIEWAPHKIRWYVDKKLVHETPDNAKLPHNPGRLYFSLWSGSEKEDAWLGPLHYTDPATAEVAWSSYTPADQPCQFPESIKCK